MFLSVIIPVTDCLVVLYLGETAETLCLIKVLNNDDLPAFGNPNIPIERYL